MEKPTFKKLTFMCMQQLTNFPYIEDDFDALTDYELLCKVVEKLNKLIENDNKQNDAIIELYNNFKALKDYVDEYLVDISEVKEDIIRIDNTILLLSDRISENTTEINNTKLEIENVKIDLTDLINQDFNILKSYVDTEVGILNDRIDNIEIGKIEVYNPTNGLFQPLQEVINDLYQITNKDGLTASEFDALDLTATEFDAYEITAYEFDSSGKIILV